MPNLTYEEYLPLRGNKVDPGNLTPNKMYYIEQDRSFFNKLPIVYEGKFGVYEKDFDSRKGKEKIYFNYLSYVVNPDNNYRAILPTFFSAVDNRITIYEQNYNLKEINTNVDNMVTALTGKRRTIIGPLPRGQSRKMRLLEEDTATIMALNTLYPKNVSEIMAKTIKSKHSRKHSKGGKRNKRKSKTRRHQKIIIYTNYI